jgi:hypothetical protein
MNNLISDKIHRTVILDNSCWDIKRREYPRVGPGVFGHGRDRWLNKWPFYQIHGI